MFSFPRINNDCMETHLKMFHASRWMCYRETPVFIEMKILPLFWTFLNSCTSTSPKYAISLEILWKCMQMRNTCFLKELLQCSERSLLQSIKSFRQCFIFQIKRGNLQNNVELLLNSLLNMTVTQLSHLSQFLIGRFLIFLTFNVGHFWIRF